jgi:catechol 2,3-dioxygenase-like lactoylglutathione lyase family enzyme
VPFRILQIDHVELFVPDRHEAARWYQRVLGLETLSEYQHWAADPRGPLMISSDGGRTKLALFEGPGQAVGSTSGFHLVAFRVDGDGFIRFLQRLDDLQLKDHRDRYVTSDSAIDHEKAFSVYFCDPYGHRLEVTTYDHEAVQVARTLLRKSKSQML